MDSIKTLKNSLTALLMMVGMGFAFTASANLIPKLGGAVVYDTDINITWLANANSGAMTWNTAQNWIAAMNSNNYLGFNNWRLPTALNADGSECSGDSCINSEIVHLRSEFGLSRYQNILFGNAAELDKFSNIQSGPYWLDTEYAMNPFYAWRINMVNGYQYYDYKSYDGYTWAVRSGDVAAVPTPPAVWLFGSALAGWVALGGRTRRS